MKDILENEGIACPARCRLHRLRAPRRRHCSVDQEPASPEAVGSHVLLAIGRRPNTDDIGLDKAGVTTDSRGYITVDDQLQTNVPGIWALGDCNGKGAFTHTSYNDFEIVAANLLDNDPRRVSDRITDLCALYRSAARACRADRNGGRASRAGKALVGMRPMTARRPRGREGRDARLHEGRGRRRHARRSSARRSSASAATRRSTAYST